MDDFALFVGILMGYFALLVILFFVMRNMGKWWRRDY